MAKGSFKFFWTTHKWVGIIIALVVLNTSATGFLLLIKKKSAWIQPIEQRGSAANQLDVNFDDILQAARNAAGAGIETWDDIDRLDVRPGKGVVKVQSLSGYEVQIDLATGDVLQSAYRRSDLIEQIHDGSFFGEWAHGYLMPVTAFSLVFLVGSGLFLFFEPKLRKRRRRKKERLAAGN
ncbi:MAG: PepSY domain-containing protein [Phycisphaerales bacterium]